MYQLMARKHLVSPGFRSIFGLVGCKPMAVEAVVDLLNCHGLLQGKVLKVTVIGVPSIALALVMARSLPSPSRLK